MTSPVNQVDTVFIGSSPLSWLEAITEAFNGRSVMVIDRAPTVGGGWAVTEFGGFGDVEMGPHFIKKRDGLYEIFDWLNIPMIPMDHAPEIVLPRKVFGYSRVVHHWRGWFLDAADPLMDDNNPGFHLLARLRLAVNFLKYRWRKSPKEGLFCYPKKGCAEIMGRLYGLARDELGIQFKFGHSVSEIRKDANGKVRLVVDDGVVTVSKCVLTSGSDIQKIQLESGEVWTPEDDNVYSNEELLICVEEPPLPHIEFFRFTRHEPHFIMVSDVTSYARPLNESARQRRIIAARFHPESLQRVPDVTAYTIDRLRQFGIIGANSKIIETRLMSFPMPHRRAERAAELDEKFGDGLELIYSYDIIAPLLNGKDRWKPALTALSHKQAGTEYPSREYAVH